MGSIIEINDTLQISHPQGFPKVLNYKKHIKKPFKAEDFKGKVFTFKNKKGIRVYHTMPVRVLLVENIKGKWLYWGLVHITQLTLDFEKKLTSGKFKIIYVYTPEEMKKAHEFIDRNPETDFFKNKKSI